MLGEIGVPAGRVVTQRQKNSKAGGSNPAGKRRERKLTLHLFGALIGCSIFSNQSEYSKKQLQAYLNFMLEIFFVGLFTVKIQDLIVNSIRGRS